MDEALFLENQLCFPLYACARRVVGRYTPLLRPLGLTYTQYIVFLVLWKEKSISVRDLGRRLYLDSGTLTPLLKKMENEGYVVRRRNPEDERVVTVSLTPQGQAMKSRAEEIPGEMGKCMPLSGQEAQELYRLLYKVLAAVEDEEEA